MVKYKDNEYCIKSGINTINICQTLQFLNALAVTQIKDLFRIDAALSYRRFYVNSRQTLYFFSLLQHHVTSHEKLDKYLPSPSMCPPCGTVDPWLLVLVNALSMVTHKAFVFHHAAVSAHPLCQPARLSPGIIYTRSTEHMGHSLSSLSFSPLVPFPV